MNLGNRLKEALDDLPVIDPREVNRSKLGWYLKKNTGRIIDGLMVEPATSSERRAWRVTKIELAPPLLTADIPRLLASLSRERDDMLLVGRRHLRSNNSWMHNVKVLTKGQNRCTMQIHPDDAARLGIADGGKARVTSRVGEVVVAAEHTDAIRPGVISIPHGFGQQLPGVQLAVANAYEGVNTNLLTDEYFVDAISGNIALNGVPVTVSAA